MSDPQRAPLTRHARPLSVPHAALADRLLRVVMDAAQLQMGYFRGATKVTIKADKTPVTAADHESEVLLVEALRRVAPGIPVVAEEEIAAGVVPPALDKPGTEYFLVDPLDGTREFVAGRKDFTINIALVRDRVARFGLIYAPAYGQFYATLGDDHAVEACFAPNAPYTRMTDVAATAIHTRAAPAAGLTAVTSLSHNTPGTDAFLAQYSIARRVSAGSSLKFGLLAKGEADIYPRVGPTCEWDTAAGDAILAAAGGCVTTLDGSAFHYGKAHEKFRNPDFVAWGRAPVAATW